MTKQLRQRRRFKFCPQARAGGRRFAQPLQKRFEIESGAPAQNRHAAALLYAGDRGLREPGELRGVKHLVEFDHINQMMRHRSSLFRGRLGGSDVQAAIDLHCIDGNDFAVEAPGQREGHGGFANGGWAGDEDGAQGLRHGGCGSSGHRPPGHRPESSTLPGLFPGGS